MRAGEFTLVPFGSLAAAYYRGVRSKGPGSIPGRLPACLDKHCLGVARPAGTPPTWHNPDPGVIRWLHHRSRTGIIILRKVSKRRVTPGSGVSPPRRQSRQDAATPVILNCHGPRRRQDLECRLPGKTLWKPLLSTGQDGTGAGFPRIVPVFQREQTKPCRSKPGGCNRLWMTFQALDYMKKGASSPLRKSRRKPEPRLANTVDQGILLPQGFHSRRPCRSPVPWFPEAGKWHGDPAL